MIFQAPPSAPNNFAPHPGTITFHAAWNHSAETQPADGVPDANKFVYYDREGHGTSDRGKATTRVPIVEVEMLSFDAAGNLVEPSKAVRIMITEYGPNHRFLRHSTGAGPAP